MRFVLRRMIFWYRQRCRHAHGAIYILNAAFVHISNLRKGFSTGESDYKRGTAALLMHNSACPDRNKAHFGLVLQVTDFKALIKLDFR